MTSLEYLSIFSTKLSRPDLIDIYDRLKSKFLRCKKHLKYTTKEEYGVST